jgi:hypothetical protein
MDGHLKPGNPFHWTVSAEDAGDRESKVLIGVRGGRIVFKTPPGEGFSMDPDNADFLSAAVAAASERARGQR